MLNGELLDDIELPSNKLQFVPVISLSHVGKFLTLTLPARSIGFYVIPNALSTLCIHEEEMDMVKDEIKADHEKETSKDYIDKTAETLKSIADIDQLYKIMEKELDSNEHYYHDAIKRKEWRELLIKKIKEQKEKIQNSTTQFLNEMERQELLNKFTKMEDQSQIKPKSIMSDNNDEVIKISETNDKDVDKDMTMNPAEPEKILETNEDIKNLLNKPDVQVPVVRNDGREKRSVKTKSIKTLESENDQKDYEKNLSSKNDNSSVNKNSKADSDSNEEVKYGSLQYGETYVNDDTDFEPMKCDASDIEDFSQYDIKYYKDQVTPAEYKILEKMRDNKVGIHIFDFNFGIFNKSVILLIFFDQMKTIFKNYY